MEVPELENYKESARAATAFDAIFNNSANDDVAQLPNTLKKSLASIEAEVERAVDLEHSKSGCLLLNWARNFRKLQLKAIVNLASHVKNGSQSIPSQEQFAPTIVIEGAEASEVWRWVANSSFLEQSKNTLASVKASTRVLRFGPVALEFGLQSNKISQMHRTLNSFLFSACQVSCV